MNPVPLFLIVVTPPLLLGGCGEKTVNDEELEEREGIYYIIGSDTPYTGKSFALYPNGQKEAEGNYKDGKLEGTIVFWHENGQKDGEVNYKDGKWDGLFTYWHENGKKQIEGNNENGKKNGLWIFWNENGQKKVEVSYKDGVVISERYWNSKGEPVNSWEQSEAK